MPALVRYMLSRLFIGFVLGVGSAVAIVQIEPPARIASSSTAGIASASASSLALLTLPAALRGSIRALNKALPFR